MIKFTEIKFKQAILELLKQQGIPHLHGGDIGRADEELLLKAYLRELLASQYQADAITPTMRSSRSYCNPSP